MDEESFESFLYKIEIEKNEKIFKLNYIVTKKGISISGTHSLFELSNKELKTLIKDSYKVAYLKEEYIELHNDIILNLLQSGFNIIPLDDCIFIKTDENIEIEYDDSITIQTEDI